MFFGLSGAVFWTNEAEKRISMKFNYKRSVVLGADRVDLCSTCDNAETCDLPIKKQPPVLDCDQFAVAPSSESAEIFDCGQKRGKMCSAESVKLCDDCQNREGCTFPESGNHLWECNEYR